MQPKTNANVRTDVDGYLVDAEEWNEELAVEMAWEAGFSALSPDQRQIITALRRNYTAGHPNTYPLVRHVCSELGLTTGCIKTLFNDPSIAWRIAGLPRSGEMHAYMPNSALE
ncbi:MAG: TusE/DsrC/DsvC family sulfur relay protein [Candidatus Thiodiazotropha sp.]